MPNSAFPKVTMDQINDAAKRLSNWGRWGPNDEIGTLNNITPQDIVNAAKLVRKGKAFSLGLNFDNKGPQNGKWGGRFNPIHTMLMSGTDAVAGRQEAIGVRYADDMVSMPLQCGTQWDALGHIFFGEKMWNGYDARLVDSTGAEKNGIEKTRDKMVGRGVLLDIARFKGVDSLKDGEGISTRRSGKVRRRAESGSAQRRLRDFSHRAHGAVPRVRRMGRLRRRRRAGASFRNRRMDSPHRHCRDLRGHLGLRGAPQ